MLVEFEIENFPWRDVADHNQPNNTHKVLLRDIGLERCMPLQLGKLLFAVTDKQKFAFACLKHKLSYKAYLNTPA